ncbi:unnamed protein product [Arctia plantaginis]|uniref:Odorant receptor n=2 Tax=Arctia plantaginis TaxID=874455 RepID=A0A8S1B0X2_ARCPL|nr:unnamed protein product [Arctia plantaginis]
MLRSKIIVFNRFLEEDRPFVKKNWRFFYIVPAVLVHLISLTTHMGVLISKKQVINVAHMLPPFLVSIHATLKALVIIPKTAEISTIMKDLGALWRTNYTDKQTKEKNRLLKRLNFCNKANFWVAMVGTAQYLISPMLEILIRRFILQQPCELLLPVPASHPFDLNHNWFVYTAVYFFQSYTMFLLVYVYNGSELILITLCGLLANEFVMLKHDLSRTTPTPNTINENGIGIEEFIKKHQKLIRLSRQLDNVFNRMIFIELLFVGITSCAFRFAGEFARGLIYTLSNYVAVTILLVTVFYVCYYGELLTSASVHLGNVAYQNLWYEGSKEYKQAIRLIIKRSQTPCGLTSLKYAAVSLNTFTKVVSTTWSYFSLMNSVYTVAEQ